MKSTRCAAWIWYRGDAFAGFAQQPGRRTVQSEITAALSALGIQATAMPAGRTDKGVHARMQVLSFRVPGTWELPALKRALGEALRSGDVGICAIRSPHPSFHAQWSATGKEYRYRLRLSGASTAEERSWLWSTRDEPRIAGATITSSALTQVLQRAVGQRDFIAFHEKSSVRKPRTLASAQVIECAEGAFEVRLVGDSFARYQVRYLVGTACAVAAGVIPVGEWEAALDSGAPLGGLRAPAHGLVLWEVRYDTAVDPFGPDVRAAAPGLPSAPPFALPATG